MLCSPKLKIKLGLLLLVCVLVFSPPRLVNAQLPDSLIEIMDAASFGCSVARLGTSA